MNHKLVKQLVLAAALAGMAGSSTGCFAFTTKHEGQELRQDVTSLEERLNKKEASIEEKIARLDETLEKATALLQKNSAGIGADVAALGEEQNNLNGLVMEARRETQAIKENMASVRETYEARIADLEERLAEVESKLNAPPPATANDLFGDAQKLLEDKSWGKARSMLRLFVQRFPDDRRVDEAQFLMARAFAGEGAHKKAIAAYQTVFDKFPKSKYADDALYEAGQNAEDLKWCTDARAYYGVLRKKYPKSALSKKAANRDKVLRKARKNKRICKS